MIQSEREALNEAEDGPSLAPHFIHHVYKGGPPPFRLRRMQYLQEGRARRLGIPWDTVDLRHVYAKTGGMCGICRQPVGIDEFAVDHIIPTSRGGPHVLENLQPVHQGCNSRKGNR